VDAFSCGSVRGCLDTLLPTGALSGAFGGRASRACRHTVINRHGHRTCLAPSESGAAEAGTEGRLREHSVRRGHEHMFPGWRRRPRLQRIATLREPRGCGETRQTRGVQVAVPLRAWRFDSSQPHRWVVHPRPTVEAAPATNNWHLHYRHRARLAIPRSTVRDWLVGPIPRRAIGGSRKRCAGDHNFAELPAEYAHLLGLYLGDGCISAGPRAVYKLRIVLDLKYPGIIERDMLGVHWTTAGNYTIYVSRKADVATLDQFIGPKR